MMYDFFSEGLDLFYNTFKSYPFSSSVDIIEKDNTYEIECEVPGYEEKDLKISINKNQLIIEGKNNKKSDDNIKYYLKERKNKDFKKIYELNTNIDKNNIKASLKNGVLYVSLNKKENEKPTIINITK